MERIAVIAIFDIGKTNKKLFLFDEHYHIVWEQNAQFDETADEDGDACEDIAQLTQWVLHSLEEVLRLPAFEVKAVNFTAYGASFVHLDAAGKPVAPLYNYLKTYPEALKQEFYHVYGGEAMLSQTTASPVLGSLNSGMQLYRIKKEQPGVYNRIHCSLHLPQYISYLVTGKCYTDITSIGCHTQLWDFTRNKYHEWVLQEGIDRKLAPLFPSDKAITVQHQGHSLAAGVGLHDSSAALIPYLKGFAEPFVLISTGTWCISLNPFNKQPLTAGELQLDCLCYMEYQGRPVKAARLFAGNEHEMQTRRLAYHFNKPIDFYRQVEFNPDTIASLQQLPVPEDVETPTGTATIRQSVFSRRDLSLFSSYEMAYHCLIADIMQLQRLSTQLVIEVTPVKRIFVDGGFGKNPVFMHLLAAAFPHMEVFAASVAQATAVGAALAIHPYWNSRPLPGDLIAMKYYTVTQNMEI
jgi:sugar (pentulose or hexulose) kinase